MDKGFITINRSDFESNLWTEKRVFSKWEAWTYLIHEAKFTDCEVLVGRNVIKLKRGQLCVSLSFLSLAWGWHVSKVRRFIDYLRRSNRLLTDTVTDGKATQITICNYDGYGMPPTEPRHSNRRNRDTITDDNYKNKEKEDIFCESIDSNTSLVNTTPREEETILTWRNDFETYLQLVRDANNSIRRDSKWLSEMKQYYPGIDIIKTMDKACLLFWATKEGWMHKRKTRTKELNMRLTLIKALSQSQNKVYDYGNKQREDIRNNFTQDAVYESTI